MKTEYEAKRVAAPREVAVDVLAAADYAAFPVLEAIVGTPPLRPDGSIFEGEGYDKLTRSYYNKLIDIPAIGSSMQDVLTARDLLVVDLFGDFPFVDEPSRAHALAALITVFVLPILNKTAPGFIFDSPKRGTGKSMLSELMAIIAMGGPAALLNYTNDEAELEKRITAILLTGLLVIVADNIPAGMPIRAAALARLLTRAVYENRLLQTNESRQIPCKRLYIFNGCNMLLDGDLGRRFVLSRLDAKLAEPWKRPATGFRHPHLERWAMENRGQLIAAVLTLIRGWFAAGCPKPIGLPEFGGFNHWSEVVGGILQHAGVSGFLGNMADVTAVDEDTSDWAEFLAAIHEWKPEIPFTVKELCFKITTSDLFANLLPMQLANARNLPSFAKRLGHALKSRRDDPQLNGFVLRRGPDDRTGVAQWIVEKQSTPAAKSET